jgi:hypothetical protein
MKDFDHDEPKPDTFPEDFKKLLRALPTGVRMPLAYTRDLEEAYRLYLGTWNRDGRSWRRHGTNQ